MLCCENIGLCYFLSFPRGEWFHKNNRKTAELLCLYFLDAHTSALPLRCSHQCDSLARLRHWIGWGATTYINKHSNARPVGGWQSEHTKPFVRSQTISQPMQLVLCYIINLQTSNCWTHRPLLPSSCVFNKWWWRTFTTQTNKQTVFTCLLFVATF